MPINSQETRPKQQISQCKPMKVPFSNGLTVTSAKVSSLVEMLAKRRHRTKLVAFLKIPSVGRKETQAPGTKTRTASTEFRKVARIQAIAQSTWFEKVQKTFQNRHTILQESAEELGSIGPSLRKGQTSQVLREWSI